MKAQRILKNKKGQGLVEYLIIVALVAVGSIAVMRVISSQINYQYAKINRALGGNKVEKPEGQEITAAMLKKKDLSTFMSGSRQNSNSAESESSANND